MTLLPAYPYFGGKRAIADRLWDAFGIDVANYVEPFCGSAAVLLARPHPGRIETCNDLSAFIINFMRAIAADPDKVAHYACWPVSELCMHARHSWLLEHRAMVEACREDPEYYDARAAGWWVWGASIWIGSGWCDHGHRNSGTRQRPHLSVAKQGLETAKRYNKRRPFLDGRDGTAEDGRGVFRRGSQKVPRLQGVGDRVDDGVGVFRKDLHESMRKRPRCNSSGVFSGRISDLAKVTRLPHLIGPHNGKKKLPSLSGSSGEGVGYGRGIFASGRREDLRGYFAKLAERLARVRLTCGDWSRVVTPAVTISHGTTAVLLDPPYSTKAKRTKKLYAEDSDDVAVAVRNWAIANGDDPKFRIALCGYVDEHAGEMPSSWRCMMWKSNGGYGNHAGQKNENSKKERVWFSPYCLGGEKVAGPLFERAMRSAVATRLGSEE